MTSSCNTFALVRALLECPCTQVLIVVPQHGYVSSREGKERGNPTSYPEYPHPEAKPVSMHLGKAKSKGGHGDLTTTANPNQGQETITDNYSFSGATLAKAESTDHRLMFITPTLQQPVHISGTPRISIRLACDKPAANLSVWLVSLPWNDGRDAKITDNIITRGWADPQNYRSIRESEPLEPGKFYEMSFDLQPDDQVIPAGQQIGLMIFSSDREFTLHPEPGTQLTIDLDATSLALPVLGGKEKLQEAFTAKDEKNKK